MKSNTKEENSSGALQKAQTEAPKASSRFPVHWGPEPLMQTRDYRPLPGDYGMGSGTLARWIQENLDKDAASQKQGGLIK